MSEAIDTLWTADDLAAFLRMSPKTVRAKVSRAPDQLPPRAPGYLVRWNPEAVRQWSMGATPARRKVGRPRKAT